MSELMDFLTSQEALVVYIIATASCLICMIIYFLEKGNAKRKQKHNTRELNKLIEKVKKEMHIEKESIEEYSEPVMESVEEVVSINSVDELLENTKELKPITIEQPTTLEIKEEKKDDIVIEDMDIIEEVPEEKELEVVRINNEDSDIQYTTVEPDQATAKLELEKLKEELEQEDKKKEEIIDNNIKLTSFEEEQESTAIISLEELIKKSKEMYEKNELTQYIEENTAPISLEELALQTGVTQTKHEEPFIIEQVVLEEREEVKEEIKPEEVKEVVQMKMDDFKTVNTSEVKKFKSSPIISPIFGIEKTNDLELENTANFEKLDKEINKSNEFLVSLQDLQEKLKG